MGRSILLFDPVVGHPFPAAVADLALNIRPGLFLRGEALQPRQGVGCGQVTELDGRKAVLRRGLHRGASCL